MNQHTSSSSSSSSPLLVKPLLNESIAGGEMLNDVFVSHVIDLDDVVLELHEESIVEWQPQDGDYVCDVGLGQGVFAL